jgi:hypothetical protein
LIATGTEFLVIKMKKFQANPIKLINPLNQEMWLCLDYRETRSIDGVEYILVCKPETIQRKHLMRKDALVRSA